MTAGAQLDPELFRAVSELLGITTPAPDQATLAAVAEAAHRVCGYDTTPKQLWATGDRRTDPPGLNPDQYWHQRLVTGATGTCWATTVAIDAWLRTAGYDTHITAWTLVGDRHRAGHGTNTVTVDDTTWILETSSRVPTPLRWPNPGEAHGGPLAQASNADGAPRLHLPRVSSTETKTYELHTDNISYDQITAAYRDAVRTAAEHQTNLVWSRTRTDGITESIGAGTYLQRRGTHVEHGGPVNGDDIAGILEAAGYSADWVDQLADADLLR